jgi:hypothetical protein
MRKLAVTLFATLAVLVVLGAVANMTGTWEFDGTFDDANASGGGFDCVLRQDGEQVTGKCSGGTAAMTGEVKGQAVTLRLPDVNPPTIFTGTLNEAGTSLAGRFVAGDKSGRFTAVKQ